MLITLELTRQQAETLMEVLEGYQDCGPDGSGWKSSEYGDIDARVEMAVQDALRLAAAE
jgi:hypothetical protein